MGDAPRLPIPPPVTGVGEPARDANGLKFDEAARSPSLSITGEDVMELDVELAAEFLSFVPSVEAGG